MSCTPRRLPVWPTRSRSIAVCCLVISAQSLAVTHGESLAEKAKDRSPQLAITAPAPAGTSTDHLASPSPTHSPSRSIGSELRWVASAGLALVLAICGALGLITKRYASRGVTGRMKVVARVGLSPKHAVHMVQVGRRLLVVGTGPQGAPSLITELDEEECPDFVSSPPAGVFAGKDAAA